MEIGWLSCVYEQMYNAQSPLPHMGNYWTILTAPSIFSIHLFHIDWQADLFSEAPYIRIPMRFFCSTLFWFVFQICIFLFSLIFGIIFVLGLGLTLINVFILLLKKKFRWLIFWILIFWGLVFGLGIISVMGSLINDQVLTTFWRIS